MRGHHRLTCALLALGLAGPALPADERSGLQLYEDFGCVLCHGISGHRGGRGGGSIAPTAHGFESFRALMRFPTGNMPAYAPEFIADDQLRRVYDYLDSIDAPPEVADLPSVNALLEALEDG